MLTCPRIEIIIVANWETNIHRKYTVESFTMVAIMSEIFIPAVLNFAADEIINAKARTSVLCVIHRV